MKIKFILIIIIVAILIGFFVGINLNTMKEKFNIDQENVSMCNFELIDIKKYQGLYENSLSPYIDTEYYTAYVVYEGLIKNNSPQKELLKEMVLKLYNEKGIFLGEAYDEVNDYVDPGKSVPFKLLVNIDRRYNTTLRKYYDESEEFLPDIYPWFLTCK